MTTSALRAASAGVGAAFPAGRGLIDGDWVRQPLWIAAIQSALLSVVLPLAAGLTTNAAINTVTTLLLLGAIYYGDPERRAFRILLQAANAATLCALYYAVFLGGAPGALIVYYTPLVLLGRDLSANGLCIETRRALAVGDRLQIALHAGDRVPLVVHTEVVRPAGREAWVLAFRDLSAVQRERIDTLVREAVTPHFEASALLVSEVRE